MSCTFTFEDDFDGDPFAQFHMTPPSPRGLPQQQYEEVAMFSEHTHTAGNYSSTTGKAAVHPLFEQFDESMRYHKYSNLSMEREIRHNRGIHFQDSMKQKLEEYNVKRKDEVFFRNNAVFDDTRFYGLCDHLAVNQEVLQKVIAVFYDQGPKDLIIDTVRRRWPEWNGSIVNSGKNQLGQSSAMHSTAQESMHFLSVMPGPSFNSRNSQAVIGEPTKSKKRPARESSVEKHDYHEAQQGEENAYELLRQRNIAENARIMKAVGIQDVMR
jgi:hypothetical protein